MADDAACAEAARILGVLADWNRLQMLSALAEGEAWVGELQARLGLDQPLTSFHLGKLRQAGLVRTRRECFRVYYRPDPDGWAAARAAIARVLGSASEEGTAP